MFTKWVTIHESYGLPRAAQECRGFLEHHGVKVRLFGETKGALYYYSIQVPHKQRKKAVEMLEKYKQRLQ